MFRTILAGALASGALLAAGGAQAQGFGVGLGAGYDGAPPYAGGGYGYGYAPYRPHRFTLAGARAGVTVLGLDIDGSAKVTIGPHDGGRASGYAPAPSYPPAPPPEPVYEPPFPPPPGYWMGYSAYLPCGCAPPPPPPCCVYGGEY